MRNDTRDSAEASDPGPRPQEHVAVSLAYTQVQHDEFWRLYAASAQPAIERACRAVSRAVTDNQMSADDMISWVDSRVWKMLREGAWPVFHDQPSPEEAVRRVAEKAKLLARWAYMALFRQVWRRKARDAKYMQGMSRVERLASVSSEPVDFERFEELESDLERVRKSVSDKARSHLAAAWQDPADRRRVAMALGVTDTATESLITKADSGEIKTNTLDQMRSRSRREIRAILGGAMGRVLAIGAGILITLLASAPAFAGEQTGGRPDATQKNLGAIAGEQTGGRPG